MYERLNSPESFWSKFYRNLYPIISISLLNFTMSNTYSLMLSGDQATGFSSIIISSLVCFVFSQSHLTIYGVSVLSIVYLNMLKATYSHHQICVLTFEAGLLLWPLWRFIKGLTDIFHFLPGKVHSGMILGVGLIILTKFFPLTIQNIVAFYERDASLLSNPLKTLVLLFQNFSLVTLILTAVSISVMFFARRKLARFPSILVLALVGIVINVKGTFLTYETLCAWDGADCEFYLVKLKNIILPRLEQLVYLLPSSVILTAVLILQQLLYIEQFKRLGRKNKEGDLGDVGRQTLVLSLSNMLCGIFGGLPVCINLFATYENFSFNKKYGWSGTKVVGLSQIIFNYLLYGPLKGGYDQIPLFVVFCIIGTPLIYFFKAIYKSYSSDIKLILLLGLLNVLTHPAFALVIAAFITINQMAMLLKPAPSEIVIDSGQRQINLRESTTFQRIRQVGDDEYYAKIITIEDDLPKLQPGQDYVLYRFTGSVSYLNIYQHLQDIMSVISRKGASKQTPFDDLFSCIMFSFRYVQNIDGEALQEFEHLIKQIKDSDRKKRVLITGLHSTLFMKFKSCAYFRKMLEEEDRCFYRLHGKDLV